MSNEREKPDTLKIFDLTSSFSWLPDQRSTQGIGQHEARRRPLLHPAAMDLRLHQSGQLGKSLNVIGLFYNKI